MDRSSTQTALAPIHVSLTRVILCCFLLVFREECSILDEGHNTGQEAVGLLSSDQGLVSSSDPGVAATKPLVQAYSTDSRRFFCDFGKSMVENFTRDGGFEIKNGCSGA
ncbi:hypothetical protein GUJ93_ZPchr0013g36872 [Zizania palustris]|uniref:Uncharacterized protein n=1 Tax=Zizania palustris TaxID=103762 RepID=A0A8J5X3V9_ZIZPA|nr:hypothetical protein GUJ93_ZPchr0013g36872 [Zizania palustris]